MASDRPSTLRSIIDQHDIKPLQTACYLNMGNFYLKLTLVPEVLDRMKLSHSEALSKAADAFEGALKTQPDDVLTSAQAHIGLAAVYEDQGEWDKARDEYKIVTTDPKYTGTPLATFAAERASQLQERRDAPRLAATITVPKAEPVAPEPTALTPGGLNLQDLLNNSTSKPAVSKFPSLLGPIGSPSTPASTSPASSGGGLQLGPLQLPKPAGPTSQP
jgi:tetratricopeptide (TPR) repeat protein